MREEDKPLTEKETKALEQANRLIAFVNERITAEPIVMADHMTISNPLLFMESHKTMLNHQRPLSRHWRTFYMRVYDLKQKLLADEKKEKE